MPSTLAEVTAQQGTFSREPADAPLAPDHLLIDGRKVRDLRYGENPHQRAAWYALDPAAGLGAPDVLQGKELSFTNLLDLDAAARIVLEFDEPAAAVIKHTNPCGAATGATIAEAYVRAREADALAAFGGIIGLNRPVDADTARAIVSTFIEAVVAPGVDDAARPILATKANLRMVVGAFGPLADPGGAVGLRREIRSVLGALLVQERDQVVEARSPWPSEGLRVVTKRAAHRRRMAGAALRLAGDGSRQVEHRDLHRRGAHARGGRGSDEPGGRGEGGGREGFRVERRCRS